MLKNFQKINHHFLHFPKIYDLSFEKRNLQRIKSVIVAHFCRVVDPD
jgi:hypothetical protein